MDDPGSGFNFSAATYDDQFGLFNDSNFDLAAFSASTDDSLEPDSFTQTHQMSDAWTDLALDDILLWNPAALNAIDTTGGDQFHDTSSDSDFVAITPQSSCVSSTTAQPDHDERSTNFGSGSSSSKRMWENSVIVFDSHPDRKIVSKKRKVFDSARRKEVAMNRAVGACVQCKIRRGSVRHLVIGDCILLTIHSATSVFLVTNASRELEVLFLAKSFVQDRAFSRHASTTLVSIHWLGCVLLMRVILPDLLDLTYSQEILESNPRTPIPNSAKEIYLIWPNCCNDDSSNALIKIRVHEFEQLSTSEGFSQSLQSILHRSYKSCLRSQVPNELWTTADDLPSIDALANCCMDSLHNCNAGPFKGLHTSFSKFSETYCSMDVQLPLVRERTVFQKRESVLIPTIEAADE